MNLETAPWGGGLMSPEESGEQYRSVFAVMEEGVVFQNAAGHVVFCNPSAERILGRQASQLLSGDYHSSAIHEDGSPFPLGEHPSEVTLRTGQPCIGVIMGLPREDKGLTWVSINSEPLTRRGDEKPYAVVSTITDITRRHQVEIALRESEKLFRTLVENQNEGIGIVDRNENFIFLNRAGERIFGVAEDGLTGRSLNEFLTPESVKFVSEQTKARSQGRRSQYELEIIRESDKAKRTIYISVVPQFDDAGKFSASFGVFSDVTERNAAEAERARLQAQLSQVQKMESVGRLAGGVAHDFNNLLTVINGYSGMLLGRMGPQDPFRRMVSEIKKAGESAAGLIEQLMAFSRKQARRQELVNLNDLVGKMQTMLSRLVGEDIEIIPQLKQDLDTVISDRHQMEQVIMNLTINARDAMPEGGTVMIETDRTSLGKICPHCAAEIRPGKYVRLSVHDTGTGIDEETKAHLFEPFFTTKRAGQGTGLGLATVHGIVHQNGGHIDVESKLGEGTAFHIYLPAVKMTPEDNADVELKAVAGGTETILLVEDQDEVRQFLQSVLTEYGYHVLEASAGEQALEICEGQPIDLVLTDVVMPKMSGSEMAARVLTRQPLAKVLFMSGYSDQILAGRAGLVKDAAFIQKPFGREMLASKIRDVLSGPSTLRAPKS
jgi:two-component system cell cycle sensor histidine kinase/response regulator CckA